MPGSEISAEAAYQAARERALRTAEALILSEGLVLDLRQQLAEVSQQRDRYAKDAVQLHEMRRRRRARDRARRARRVGCVAGCAEVENQTCDVCAGEGVQDAAEDADPDGYTYAVGQAD